MLVSGAGVIALTAWLETRGLDRTTTWPIGYAIASGLVLVGMAAVLAAREPAAPVAATGPSTGSEALARVVRTARDAFGDFLARDAALAVLTFVVLYKLCDALAGAMTAPFVLIALAYDKATYAAIVKGLGLAALLIGGFAGGAVARALPLVTALWLGAILQMVSNLAFVWLWLQPPGAGALTVAIVIENFTGAIGTVIFVAYISALCGNPLHTATQFALLSALATTGRTLLSSGTGYLVDAIGWPAFFAATALIALPALAMLAWLQRRGHFEPLDAERAERSEQAKLRTSGLSSSSSRSSRAHPR
jgi:PAT family beta-lactamase induction signal transducer AmpG